MHTECSKRVCLITEGTYGIGRDTALALARQGLTVYIVGREAWRAADAIASVRAQSGNLDVHCAMADLSSQASIQDLAQRMRRQLRRLDILLNTAWVRPNGFRLTAEGFEESWAINHLASMALTLELLPLLQAGAPARIVNLACDQPGRGPIDVDTLPMPPGGRTGLSAIESYAQSQQAAVLFSHALARRLQGQGISVNCLSPYGPNETDDKEGGLMRLAHRVLQPFRPHSARTAKALAYLASSENVDGVSGAYFIEDRQTAASASSLDTLAQDRLWELSQAQIERLRCAAALPTD